MREQAGPEPQLPSGWSIKPLPEELTFISGKAHERHISEFGRYVVVNSKFISSDGKVRKFTTDNFQPAKVGDVLMVMSDLPNGKALAKTFLVDCDDLYAVNQRVCILRAKSGHPAYFRYQLNRSRYFLSFDDGVQQTHLLNRVFEEAPVVVPESVDEQKAIARALNDIDDLIASIDALIAKKRDIKQAAMQQLLTGKTRLPGFSGEWRLCTLGDALRVRHGRDQKAIQCEDGCFPILASGGQIGRTNKPLYSKPSVLIGRKGTIDRPQFMDQPFWTVDTLFYTEIQGQNSARYLFYVFQTIDWRSYNEASGVPSLSSKTIESISLNLPEPAEQAKIAATLADFDHEIEELEQRGTKFRALREGMMQQLLTGRIRLV